MTKLNEVELWYVLEKNRSIESLIEEALDSWNRKRDTKDVVPEFIIFNINSDVTQSEILGLTVLKEKTMLKNHFCIRGSEE